MMVSLSNRRRIAELQERIDDLESEINDLQSQISDLEEEINDIEEGEEIANEEDVAELQRELTEDKIKAYYGGRIPHSIRDFEWWTVPLKRGNWAEVEAPEL